MWAPLLAVVFNKSTDGLGEYCGRTPLVSMDPSSLGQGANFVSAVFQSVCNLQEATKTRTIPGHPQGYGQVERTNPTLINLLRSFAFGSHPHDWDEHLPRCLMPYWATIHASTRCSPFRMTTGRKVHIPTEITAPINRPTPRSAAGYLQLFDDDLRTTFNTARGTWGRAYTRQKDYYDRHARSQNYQVCDIVRAYWPVPPLGMHKNFHHPWSSDDHLHHSGDRSVNTIKDSPPQQS